MYSYNALSGAVRTPASLPVIAVLVFGVTVQCAQAQESPRTPRIGILSPYSAEGSTFEDDVMRGLIDLGYVEGQSIDFEVVFANGRTDQLSALASELVRKDVDLIVTTTAPGVRAAKQATSVVPIIVGGVDDAVEQGFVDSLGEPGGNITGTSIHRRAARSNRRRGIGECRAPRGSAPGYPGLSLGAAGPQRAGRCFFGYGPHGGGRAQRAAEPDDHIRD
jgi:hypothetical protein